MEMMPDSVKEYLEEEYNNLKNNPLNPPTKEDFKQIIRIIYDLK